MDMTQNDALKKAFESGGNQLTTKEFADIEKIGDYKEFLTEVGHSLDVENWFTPTGLEALPPKPPEPEQVEEPVAA